MWNIEKDSKSNMDIPQLQKHIYMVNIFIQNIFQKGKKECHKSKGDP